MSVRTDPKLEIELPSGRQIVFQMLEAEAVLGPGGDVVLPDGAPTVKLSRTEHGILAVIEGQPLTVNGESFPSGAILEHGDSIDLGAGGRATLVAKEVRRTQPSGGGRAAAGRTAAGAGRSTGGDESKPRRGAMRRKRMPTWLLASNLVAVAVAGGALLIHQCSSSTFPRTPDDYMVLAEEQLSRGQRERAVSTLDFVLQSGPSAAVRRRAQEARDRVMAELRADADLPNIAAAGRSAANIIAFQRRYLGDDPTLRPPARMLIRKIDRWLVDFEAVLARHPDQAALLGEMRGLRQAHLTAAQLHESNSEADVVFEADYMTRLGDPRYREAIQLLDGHLASKGVGAESGAAAELRAKIDEQGRKWIDKRAALVRQLISMQRLDDARFELAKIRKLGALDEWLEVLAPLEAQVGNGP